MFIFSILSIGCSEEKLIPGNINSNELCKENMVFKETEYSNQIGMEEVRTTRLNCNGTFISTTKWAAQDWAKEEYRSNVLPTSGTFGDNFSGTWKLVETWPNSVTNYLKSYSDEPEFYNNKQFSVVQYSSSNGIKGYAIIVKVNYSIIIFPIYLGQIFYSKYENDGSLGFWGGYWKRNEN